MHDYVMMWNAIALDLNARDHTGIMNAKNQRGPTASARALAMVHVAIHDAFFGRTNLPPLSSGHLGLQGTINTFLNIGGLNPPVANAMNEGAAVSAAAATVLLNLYPDFRSVVDDAMRGFDFGSNPGIAFGTNVGNAVIADRANDGSGEGGAVAPINAYWRHREDPTNIGQGFLGQRWGTVRLFSAAAIPPLADHPVPRSDAYNRAHDQVRTKGSSTLQSGTPGSSVTLRTPLQTLIGLYWAYDGASQIGTPPRLYNQIIREIIGRNVNGADRPAASARLLALANVAMADAGISAWFHKYTYQLWRPILSIREYDDSYWNGGTAVSHALHKRCDPWWLPLGSPRTNEPGKHSFTPPFPAYPSGHATFGAAAFEITRRFFGFGTNSPDTLFFDTISDECDGRAIAEDGSFRGRQRRHHDSLLRAMFDNAVSRIYLGVHFRFDGLAESVTQHQDILSDTTNVGGVPLGRAIAHNIFSSGMSRSNAPRGTVAPKNLSPVP
jgi:Vanadium chloroperoxidase N-terminal domain/PAP2 superfamily